MSRAMCDGVWESEREVHLFTPITLAGTQRREWRQGKKKKKKKKKESLSPPTFFGKLAYQKKLSYKTK